VDGIARPPRCDQGEESPRPVTIEQRLTDGNVPPPPVTLKRPYKVEAKENAFEFRIGKD
jgi:hypothetical protein